MADPTRLLYIDDQSSDCQSAQAALDPTGQFNSYWVKSLADLANQLVIGRYDLVVSELAPFAMEEFQVLEIIRSKIPNIPIVIFTGVGEITKAVSALKLGAADYLVKTPDAFQCLPERLAAVLVERNDQSLRNLPFFHPGAENFFGVTEITQEIGFRYEFSPIPHFSSVKPVASSGPDSPGSAVPLHKDGSLIWIEIRTRPAYDEQGKVIAVDGNIRNITPAKVSEDQLAVYADEIIRKNQELAEARDKALEASQLKSDFLAMMSHDIRTPINAITGMTELLLETSLNKEQREYAEVVHDSTRILLDLINDILDFSKIEAGKLGLENIEFDLLEVVEGVAEMFATQARRVGVELTVFISPRIPSRLRGDPVRLRQVLMNLVGNAVKFTENGEVAIRVDPVDETDQYAMLLFQVRDTGIGISEQAMSQIFQPFIQGSGSTTRRYGGTGLGLAISKRLVELMDGEISVDSTEGQGSTFWFTAFLQKSPLPAVKDTQPLGLPYASVWIIAPNATLRGNLLAYLALKDIKGHSAPDLETALGMIKSEPGARVPAAVIELDLSHPGALQSMRTIRQMPEFYSSHLVLMIPFDQRSQAEKALQAGFTAYLIKPVKRAEFFEALRHIPTGKTGPLTPPVTRPESEAAPTKAGPPEKKALVLLAEDNATSQRLASIQLLKLGYQVEMVTDGIQAVQAVTRSPGKYQLVLMDCQMPELDGYDATRRIRSVEATNGTYVPVIAMTANAIKGDREICLAAGMDDYISKPVSMDTLRQITQKWIKHLGPALQTTVSQSPHTTGSLDPGVINQIRSMQEEGKPDFLTELIDIYLRELVGAGGKNPARRH